MKNQEPRTTAVAYPMNIIYYHTLNRLQSSNITKLYIDINMSIAIIIVLLSRPFLSTSIDWWVRNLERTRFLLEFWDDYVFQGDCRRHYHDKDLNGQPNPGDLLFDNMVVWWCYGGGKMVWCCQIQPSNPLNRMRCSAFNVPDVRHLIFRWFPTPIACSNMSNRPINQ